VQEQRLRFVVTASRKKQPFSAVCAEFGISRQTGYTWLKRYQAGGSNQVIEQSRRPAHSPARTETALEQAAVELRRQRPDGGADKIHPLLVEQHPEASGIAVRTVHRILQRHGLIREQHREPRANQRFERGAPKELWQMDFKGPAEFSAASPVGPLSVLDDHSRYWWR
jgi:transposase-like protein